MSTQRIASHTPENSAADLATNYVYRKITCAGSMYMGAKVCINKTNGVGFAAAIARSHPSCSTAGHHIDAIADVLGHESVDTTRRHYAFASTARRRATILAYDV